MVSLYLQDAVFESSFLQLIWHASLPAKTVLLILLALSVFSWAIIYQKYRTIRRAASQTVSFLKLYRRCTQWSDAYAVCDQYADSPIVPLFLAAYQRVREPKTGELADRKDISPQFPTIDREIRRAALTVTEGLEKHLPWLASIATSSPFIGLFGTVIGIIISFQGLAIETQTSIQAVAPGIAEALIATAAGLFVAVPAYIGYNHFVAQVHRLTNLLDSFRLEVISDIEGSLTTYGVFKS